MTRRGARAGCPGPEAGALCADGRARYLRQEVRGARGVALEGSTQHLLRRRARRAAPKPQLAAARRRDPLARDLLQAAAVGGAGWSQRGGVARDQRLGRRAGGAGCVGGTLFFAVGVCGAGFLRAQSLYGARAVSLGGASL